MCFEVRQSEFTVENTANREFTDRAVNVIDNTQQDRLGDFQDAAPISHSMATDTIKQQPHEVVNMEEHKLDRVIERSYLLGTYSWSTAQAAGTSLVNLAFPAALFNIPFIADKLKGFRYFRGGVRISVRVSANKFTYGKLIMAYDPVNNQNAYSSALFSSAYLMSGNPHVLISAAASEAVVMDVPFICPKRGIDLQNYADNEIGRVVIMVLNPLVNVLGQTNTVSIQVMAQFIESSLYFPTDIPYTGGITQSGRHKIMKAHKENTTSTAIEAARKSQAHYVTEADETIRATEGTISNGIASLTRTVQQIADVGTGVMALGALFGLSKPTSSATTDIVQIRPGVSYNNGKGIDHSIKLAMDSENSIGTLPNVGGSGVDEMDIVTLASTPALVSVYTMTSSTLPMPIMNCSFGTTLNAGIKESYCDLVASMFRWSNGTVRVKIYITASLMQAIRLVFFLSDDVTNEQDWTNLYHRVVDVQGDTDVCISLPYCQNTISDDGTISKFALWVKRLNWSTPDNAVSAPIYLNVYKAADMDFSVGEPLNCYALQSNVRDDFSVPFLPIHESISGYEHANVIWGEKYTTMREVIHKMTPYRSYSTGGAAFTYENQTAPNATYGLEIVGKFYRFWRGSVRFSLIPKTPTNNSCAVVYDSGTSPAAYINAVAFGTPVSPIIDFEVPYYSNMLFESTDSNSKLVVQLSAPSMFMSKAAGDDFSFHFRRLPPNTAINFDNTGGVSALRGFLS